MSLARVIWYGAGVCGLIAGAIFVVLAFAEGALNGALALALVAAYAGVYAICEGLARG